MQVHAPLFGESGPDVDEQISEEVRWVRAAREAVREGLPELMRLLGDPEPLIRETVALVLSKLTEDASVVRARLLKGLAVEPDVRVRIALWIALGSLAADWPPALDAAHSALTGPLPESAAAAFALVLLRGGPTTEAVASPLRAAQRDPATQETLGQVWDGDHSVNQWLEEWDGHTGKGPWEEEQP
jgi:hypothetical protein